MKLWAEQGFPHKGWTAEIVIDLNEDEGLDFEDYESCQACGRERIRFVHILRHPDYQTAIRVGCICSEKLTEDDINPRRKESDLRKFSRRLGKFLNHGWNTQFDGQILRTMKGYIVALVPTKDRKFKIWLGEKEGTQTYQTEREAKLKAFQVIEHYKKKGREGELKRRVNKHT